MCLPAGSLAAAAGAVRASIPLFAVGLLLLAACCGWASSPNTTVLELNKLPFFLGREYFVLRSARAQMIVQADRADLGPAFTWMLFDVQDARQSVRKEGAFNFVPGEGFGHSALAVQLGNFPFTALGHRTETRWTCSNGIPAVEAVWWAGGIRVTEHLSVWANAGAFRRSIRLEGAHLVGPETATLRLELPPGECDSTGGVLLQNGRGARMALAVLSRAPARIEGNGIEIGPIPLSPNQAVSLDTALVVQIPAGDRQSLVARADALVRSGAVAETAATREQWAASSSVITRDRTVQGIYDKARFGLPGMIADDGTMDAGIFEYGAQWVRDTSCTVLGALHAGHFEVTRAALQRILAKMISHEGATMIANAFEKPDLEQFDQMGELLHALRAWRDWTGDDVLIREHRDLLLALIERPLRPEFRDETGMVHNRREFWERSFTDAYELAYQTYVILGLREAAELAPSLSAADRAVRWRAEADRMLRAMLSHPTLALVDQGRLIKRRKVSGQIADHPDGFKGFQPDVPLNTEQHHSLLPDASMALPLALGVVDPRSELARRTLDYLEELWNTRWSDGGYDRYHTSTQPDQPGPWPFATTFILRAQHDAGLYDRSRRSLEWLDTCQGGRAGFWFEEIPSVRSLSKSCGLVCWTSGEIALFVVRHYLGVRFGEGGQIRIQPALYPGSPPVKANLRFRQSRLRLEIDGSGPVKEARVNGQPVEFSHAGEVRLPQNFAGGTVVIRCAGEEKRPTTNSASLQFLEGKARQLIAGCRVRASDGTMFFTPDGKGNYRALWTRDFAYMVENAGDLMPANDVESCLRALVRGVRADGAAPDRVRPDGVAVYVAGPENHPLGEPNIDNAPFLIIAADEYLKRLPKPRQRELFAEWAQTLDHAMTYIPRSTNGLAFNDPAKPHSPYGFTDTVGKTGELLFESLLYWTASKRLAARHLDGGNEKSARSYSTRASMIESNLAALWDNQAGAFLAATQDCRQIDVWGNAYAIWLDFPLGAKRARMLQFLHDNRQRYLWHGQVRHLLAGEHWQRLLTPVQPERYQNGAYWATASGWMMWALAQSDRSLAQRMWRDLIDDFKQGDICECVNEGYRQLPSYVVSATNPLAAARRLGF